MPPSWPYSRRFYTSCASKSIMPNPWVNLPPLPSSSYVLPVDVSYVDCFNKSAAPSHQIVTDQIPEPWLGSAQDACLFVLQLNPRYLLTDAPAAKKHPVIGKLNEPHFGITDRDKWWLSCFKKLALDIGCSLHPDECLKLQRKRLSIGVIAGWSAMRYRSAGGFRRSAASTGAV